eukprot:TRINITY_DN3671_c0_g2_i1.p1 TRINITY_DN3671_c0_g2~~TRINITY_DN3671_c0_g2_i1.p1  ORF type:complete len:580 (+),score=104.36 TRINITY_DN3671_c0_g2_i1:155-1741(+)
MAAAAGTAVVHCRTEGEAKEAEFTREEVARHRTRGERIWVTYKDGVYDVTDFIDMHPGGAERIMLAAGSSIDSFWGMYAQHQTKQVQDMLEEYRIGRLAGAEATSESDSSWRPGWLGGKKADKAAKKEAKKKAKEAKKKAEEASKDPYADEPTRLPALRVRTAKPFNAETPTEILADQIITPTDLFYVRHHLPVPKVDPDTYELTVEGEGLRTLKLSLEDLKTKFKKHTITATLQCSGNRRHEMKEIKEVKGLDWDVGAISTAKFSGVRLCDVLAHAGIDYESAEGEGVHHVEFVGLDKDGMTGTGYAASIPVDKAVDPHADVLLAYEMNGEVLPADHGYPVRVVVPGVTGARSVKWVSHIVAGAEESTSQWQQHDYKSFSPNVDWHNVDWTSAPSLQETPVTSAICQPRPGAIIQSEEVTVRGYAFSGGGKDIIRVDVSADSGKNWTTATLHKIPQKAGRAWAWTLWEAEVPVPKEREPSGTVQICAKATDASYNSQPDNVAPIWNLRGVVNNAWHRVQVNVGEEGA